MYEIQNAFAEPAEDGENVAIMPIQMPNIENAGSVTAGRERHKVFLPRRSGEYRFAPRQYYYPASRTGVMPKLSSDAA
jgi:hypothetical protein